MKLSENEQNIINELLAIGKKDGSVKVIQKDLAARLGLTEPKLSQLLGHLCIRGLIEKKTDASGRYIFLSPALTKTKQQNKKEKWSTEIDKLFEFYKKACNRPRYALTEERKKKISACLNVHGIDKCGEAISIIANSKFHRGENDRGKEYQELDKHIFKNPEKIDEILSWKEKSK